MRFKNYLIDDIDPEIVYEIIKKDCKSIFKEIKNSAGCLYRGTKHNINSFERIVPRVNRKPKDMPGDIHILLDEMFYKRFGWKVRSEGVFATGSLNQADQYGIVYYFFPADGYKFIWSPYIDDLYSYINGLLDSESSKEEISEAINDMIVPYTNVNMKKAIYSANEITFKCSHYYITDKYLLDYIIKDRSL